MNSTIRRTLSLIIAVAFIAGGLLTARWFMNHKPQAKRRRAMSSMVPVVETVRMKTGRQIRAAECLGTVEAEKIAALQPQVTGRITAVSPNLVEGGIVNEGDVLVEIEAVDYELALAKAQAALLTAQSKYRIEQGQQDVVRHELTLMDEQQDDGYRDLMLREPQLKSAEAAVKSAELAVETAKLNLERTRIRAPFRGVVVSENADIGDYAQPAKILIELAAIDRYFVRASVPLSTVDALPQLDHKSYTAALTLSDGSVRAAHTYKLLPGLTQKGRMARLLLTAENPYADAERPLLIGEYVRIRIEGEPVAGALLLPRKYLRDGNVVWTIDTDNKLHILPAQVIQGYDDDALVRIDGPAELEIVTTDLSAAVDGMTLRRVGEKPTKKKPGAPTGNDGSAKERPAEKEA